MNLRSNYISFEMMKLRKKYKDIFNGILCYACKHRNCKHHPERGPWIYSDYHCDPGGKARCFTPYKWEDFLKLKKVMV